ncbi:MAG: phosphotransferase [Pseudomonadota bacterium]
MILDSTPREALLRNWLASLKGCSADQIELETASADASFRRYFRLQWNDSSTRIVMDAPPEHEDCRPFVHVTQLLRQGGLHAPECFAQNLTQGFLLLEDLGTTTYLDSLNQNSAPALYSDAIDALIKLQSIPAENQVPPYDRDRLSAELDLFPVWYLGQHCKLHLSEQEQQEWHDFSEWLLDNIESQPRVLVHRDYHCRNLMVCSPDNPGIIDYQDAVFGSITYDLMSLFKDAYIQWEEAQILDWVIQYWQRARKAGLPVADDISVFHEQCEWMGLQRHLKILGIFARLFYRDGKDRYLADLPLVLDYTRKVAQRFDRCRFLVRLLDKAEAKQIDVGYTF